MSHAVDLWTLELEQFLLSMLRSAGIPEMGSLAPLNWQRESTFFEFSVATEKVPKVTNECRRKTPPPHTR